MKTRLQIIRFFFSIVLLYSCNDKENSQELTKRAVQIYLDHELDEDKKINQSLSLINSALNYDSENIAALNHKRTLLFYKKDIEGLLNLSDKFLEIAPNSPFYLGQKGLYLEIDGDIKLANTYYDKAITTYEKRLRKDSLNFDLYIEYLGILGLAGDSSTVDIELKKLKNQNLENYQHDILNHMEEKQIFYPKDLIINYFEGNVDYKDIENSMSN
ncbi:MAG: hypothetical protein V2I33_20015 [Kangiellaceae bacterium]|jgi:tetratricopeptide (TPR) repeat protein|nr:hypothetical protein [Kangiellaceae bacterium]